jgi:alanine-synthesizing transaminase
VFSPRTPSRIVYNRLTAALARVRADGRSILDLTISNPTRAGFDYPADLLSPLADARALRYDPQPFGLIEARRAVARDYERLGLAVSPEHIVLTASTSDAYSMLFKLLAAAGDEVLVPRPSYPLFEHLTRLDVVVARPYDLEYHGTWTIDFDSVERSMTPQTRAILVVSPNNPTGSFIERNEMNRLASMCAPRDVAIIADEVFADYELEPGSRAAAGHAMNSAAVLSFTLGGLSKSVGLPQVKLGWIAVGGPEPLVASALARLELISDTYLAVSTPVQVAAERLLSSGAGIRQQISRRVVGNYRCLRSAAERVPALSVLRSNGGWYAVVQVPSFESEEDLVVRLVTDDGVAVHPGYFFDFARESYLIVSLLPPMEVFTDGIDRMLRHFDCSSTVR